MAGPNLVGAAMVEHFVERWEADDTFRVLLRAASTNEVAARRVRAVVGQAGPAGGGGRVVRRPGRDP